MSQAGYLVWYANADLTEVEAVRILSELVQVVGMDRADAVYRDDLDECLASDYLASELFRLYEHGTQLFVEADTAGMGDRLEAVISTIPASIRGDFMPNRPFIRIGRRSHFVDAADDSRDPVPFTVMVGCWGYSTPNDTKKMRGSLFSLPGVTSERQQLERITGQLDQALFLKF